MAKKGGGAPVGNKNAAGPRGPRSGLPKTAKSTAIKKLSGSTNVAKPPVFKGSVFSKNGVNIHIPNNLMRTMNPVQAQSIMNRIVKDKVKGNIFFEKVGNNIQVVRYSKIE